MSKKSKLKDVIITVLTGLFFLVGVVLFIGSLVAFLFSQGGEGEITPDYMGGIIVENELTAYSTIIFIISLFCFGIADYLSKKN